MPSCFSEVLLPGWAVDEDDGVSRLSASERITGGLHSTPTSVSPDQHSAERDLAPEQKAAGLDPAVGVFEEQAREHRMNELVVLDDFVLIDGTGGAPMPAARVVIEQGVIVFVDAQPVRFAGATGCRGARTVAATRSVGHPHASRVQCRGVVWPERFSEQQLLLNWRAYLRSGVTSVVSVGDDKSIVLAARAAERDGKLVAPRIFAAGSVFTAPGGHPVGTILHGEASRIHDLALEVSDPADGRRELRRLVEQDDVDLIKVIYSSIRVTCLVWGGTRWKRLSKRRTPFGGASSPMSPLSRKQLTASLPAWTGSNTWCSVTGKRARERLRRRSRTGSVLDTDALPVRQDGSRRR